LDVSEELFPSVFRAEEQTKQEGSKKEAVNIFHINVG
jgi:hypothetical protein